MALGNSQSQSPRSPPIPGAAPTQGHVIAVVGGKEGVGKSVFCTNLALALSMDTKKNIGLIDLDPLSTGDLNLLLGINRVKGFGDDLLDGKIRDAESLKRLTTNYSMGQNNGVLSVLQMYSAQERVLKEDMGRMELALKLFRRAFPLTIIDCGSRLEGSVLKALDLSTMILVVTNPEILVINHTRRIIDRLQTLMFPPQMTKLVLNKDDGQGYSVQFLEQMFKREVIAHLPEDTGLVMNSLSKGVPFVGTAPDSILTKEYFALSRVVSDSRNLMTLARLSSQSAPQRTSLQTQQAAAQVQSQGPKDPKAKSTNPRSAFKLRVQSLLIDKLDLKKEQLDRSLSSERKLEMRNRASKIVSDILNQEDHSWKTREESAQLCEEILNEALGLGPLESLLANDEVTEIMVNRDDKIYVEEAGVSKLSPVTFSSNAQLLSVIERIVNPLGRRIDEKTPFVDARLMDGSRVHAIIPPLSIDGPMLTIRKFPKKRLTVEDLVKYNSVTQEMADFLQACIESRLNVLVSGGTGSGKTTLLNILSNFIPGHERILTVEDSAELQLGQEHVGRLETRPPNIEGSGEVSIRDLVKQTLRMRPDRIIVGEVRSGEALDMLQAMNTGHDGSMATIHANTPKDCLARLETLVLMAGMDLPVKAIREQVASAVHLIVQQSRMSDGSRKITYVTEVIGLQADRVETRDIFVYRQTGRNPDTGKIVGKHTATGFIPHFMERIESLGIKFPPGLFKAA